MSVKGMVVVMTFSVMAWKSLGIKWTTEALHTYSCERQDTILLWKYSLEKNETVQNIQWYFNHSTQIAYESESVKFLVSPLYKGRVERIGKMGILLKNVSSIDAGNYSLHLHLGPESPEIMQRIFLTVFDSPTSQCKPRITKNPDNVLFCSINSCGGIQFSTAWRISEKYYFVSNESYLKINSSWNAELVSCCLHRQCQNYNLEDFCASTFIFFAEDKHAPDRKAPDSGYTENSVNLTAAVIVLALIALFSPIVFVICFCYKKKKYRLCPKRRKETNMENGHDMELEEISLMIGRTSETSLSIHVSKSGSHQGEGGTSDTSLSIHVSKSGSHRGEGGTSDPSFSIQASQSDSHGGEGSKRYKDRNMEHQHSIELGDLSWMRGRTSDPSLSIQASQSDSHGGEGSKRYKDRNMEHQHSIELGDLSWMRGRRSETSMNIPISEPASHRSEGRRSETATPIPISEPGSHRSEDQPTLRLVENPLPCYLDEDIATNSV